METEELGTHIDFSDLGKTICRTWGSTAKGILSLNDAREQIIKSMDDERMVVCLLAHIADSLRNFSKIPEMIHVFYQKQHYADFVAWMEKAEQIHGPLPRRLKRTIIDKIRQELMGEANDSCFFEYREFQIAVWPDTIKRRLCRNQKARDQFCLWLKTKKKIGKVS